MAKQSSTIESKNIPETIEFLRQKDYKFVKELGRGGCGKTILIQDETINETFVCKKYSPLNKAFKENLFKNFLDEIKILHLLYHENIVRIFNYYMYPENITGYVLMEYVEGDTIENYLKNHPENINEVFIQVVEGFCYLEKKNILHRDIRPQNIMVTNEGLVKIIDFGFSKQIVTDEDFDKSISLNWWCDIPSDFESQIYDFKTELYFIGKLFEQIIQDNGIEYFNYKKELSKMCQYIYDNRGTSFSNIRQSMLENKSEIPFNDQEIEVYRNFSRSLKNIISTLYYSSSQYFDDNDKIQSKIEDVYRRVMLEEEIPDNDLIIRCFIKGNYRYWPSKIFPTCYLKSFIELLKSSTKDKKNIIFKNLFTKLDSIDRTKEDDEKEEKELEEISEDDIPF